MLMQPTAASGWHSPAQRLLKAAAQRSACENPKAQHSASCRTETAQLLPLPAADCSKVAHALQPTRGMCRCESTLGLLSLLLAALLSGCELEPAPPRAATRDAAIGGDDASTATAGRTSDANSGEPLIPAPKDAAVGGSNARSDASFEDPDSFEFLCDGSRDIRLGYQMAGGGPSQNDVAFMRPYGYVFMVIDGSCHYYLSTLDAREGMRSGELSAAEAEQISRDVSFAKLPKWNGHYGQSCSDAPGLNLITSSSRLSLACSCGCEGAPQGAEAAMNKAGEWHARLAARAAVLSGPIRALAKREERVDASTPAYAWPFEFAIADRPGLIFEPSYRDPPPPGVLFEGAEATALHALRAKANADYKEAREKDTLPPSPVFIDLDSRGYLFYLRDELPTGQAAAVGAFFSLPAEEGSDRDAG